MVRGTLRRAILHLAAVRDFLHFGPALIEVLLRSFRGLDPTGWWAIDLERIAQEAEPYLGEGYTFPDLQKWLAHAFRRSDQAP